MTSTSFDSFSDRVPEAFNWGGGESIAAIFFLFFDEKKLPKKPDPSDERSNDGLEALGGAADAGIGRPVFGSTCVGLFALERSLTMAIAYLRCKNQRESNHRVQRKTKPYQKAGVCHSFGGQGGSQ